VTRIESTGECGTMTRADRAAGLGAVCPERGRSSSKENI
jgi:hypothetical protein